MDNFNGPFWSKFRDIETGKRYWIMFKRIPKVPLPKKNCPLSDEELKDTFWCGDPQGTVYGVVTRFGVVKLNLRLPDDYFTFCEKCGKRFMLYKVVELDSP